MMVIRAAVGEGMREAWLGFRVGAPLTAGPGGGP